MRLFVVVYLLSAAGFISQSFFIFVEKTIFQKELRKEF